MTEETTQTEGLRLINRTHPEYNSLVTKWEFWQQSYLGGQGYIESNLFKYYKEGDEEFNARVERAYRENHSKRVVDIINSYLFKVPAARNAKTKNENFDRFQKNVDGRGRSINRFMKNASLWSSVMGRVYIMVDKMKLADGEQTGTAADNLKAPPYAYVVFPRDVMDIAFDGNGRVKWTIIRETYREDDDPFDAAESTCECYRLWTQEEWVLFDDKGEETGRDAHGLGIVPMIIVDNEEGATQYEGQGLIADISYLDRAIFNNWSRLDTIVCDQTFSQLIFPIEGLPIQNVADDNELIDQFLQLSTKRALLFSSACGVKPEYISPDASQADFILKMIERQIRQLYASISLAGETGEEVKAESGVAKAYDFDKMNTLLAGKGDNLEEAELELAMVAGRWLDTEIEYEVDYPDEFDVRSLAEEISIAQELALIDVSETFKKEIDKIIVKKALPKLPKKIVDRIFDEIDKKGFEDSRDRGVEGLLD